MRRVRAFQDGKMKIAGDGLLEHDEKGIPISGDVRNCWAGFSLLQALFVKEHNAVCDMLKVSLSSHSISPYKQPIMMPILFLLFPTFSRSAETHTPACEILSIVSQIFFD